MTQIDDNEALAEVKREIFIDSLLEGKSLDEAKIEAGYPPKTSFTSIAKGLDRRKLIDKYRNFLALNVPAALSILLTEMVNPSKEAKVKTDIADKILNKAGLINDTGEQSSQQNNILTSIIVIPDKNVNEEPYRVINMNSTVGEQLGFDDNLINKYEDLNDHSIPLEEDEDSELVESVSEDKETTSTQVISFNGIRGNTTRPSHFKF